MSRAALTEEQRLAAAHAVIIGGVDQHVVAGMFGVNPGRVNEAVAAVRLALADPKGVTAAMTQEKVS